MGTPGEAARKPSDPAKAQAVAELQSVEGSAEECVVAEPSWKEGVSDASGNPGVAFEAPFFSIRTPFLVGADGANSGWATDDASALPGLLRKMNGRGNAEGDGSSRDVDWRTADFEPGDVVALCVDACHLSASNESGAAAGGKGARVRLSCDTRWQPASKETDPRIRVWRRRVGDAVVDEVRDRAR